MTTMLPIRRSPTHPGQMLLREFLEPGALTQADAADRLGISYRRLKEIIDGRRGVSPDTAHRLERLCGMDADFWLTLQRQWDLWHAR